uniref:Uncharacterized protein n=1 Tax=Leersia perrieri TaxID=77586 RepID=A0A0D9UXS4_9ORYZ
MAAAARRWPSMSQSRYSSTYSCHDMPPFLYLPTNLCLLDRLPPLPLCVAIAIHCGQHLNI